MSDVGTIKSVSIANNRDDTTNKVRLAQVEMSSAQDIQTVQVIGDDDRGLLPETKIIVLDIGAGWKLGIPILDGVEPTAAAGERYLYSQDPTTKAVKASIKLKADGTIVMNNGSGTAVEFGRLKTEFEKLQDAWDAFATEYVPGGPSATGTPVKASTSGASIDNAKSETVLLP